VSKGGGGTINLFGLRNSFISFERQETFFEKGECPLGGVGERPKRRKGEARKKI